jgi:glutamyl-tRNA synthetase
LLRIDDADPNMVHPGGIADIHETIAWLGIDIDMQLPSQQSRYSRYQHAIEELRTKGFVYACNCTRSQIRAASATGEYPGSCRDKGLALDQQDVSWRCRLDEGMPDPIVRGKNGIPAYHIASLCDDVDAGITHIIRGEDLAQASVVQRQIAVLAPSLSALEGVFIEHHALVLDEAGGKLSKSIESTALRTLRLHGLQRSAVVEQALRLADPLTAAYLVDNIST